MNSEQLSKIQAVCKRHPEIGLLYFFGSRARGTAGPMSDYDFAVQTLKPTENLEFSVAFGSELAEIFDVEDVDVIVLNAVKDPVLRREATLLGKCLYMKDAALRYGLEESIFREYEDTMHLRSVQSDILHEQIGSGIFGKPTSAFIESSRSEVSDDTSNLFS